MIKRIGFSHPNTLVTWHYSPHVLQQNIIKKSICHCLKMAVVIAPSTIFGLHVANFLEFTLT
jgi:hypothetical protein